MYITDTEQMKTFCREMGRPVMNLSLIHISMCIRDRYSKLSTIDNYISPALVEKAVASGKLLRACLLYTSRCV